MSHPGPPRIGFRAWLALLAMLAAVPMTLFSVLTLLVVIERQREAENVALQHRAEAIAGTLDRYLSARVSMLAAIAHGDAARQGDIQGIYSHAARMAPYESALEAIALIDRTGAILFSTQYPYGEALPDSRDPAGVRQIIDTGLPLVSGPYVGALTPVPLVAVGVPVFVAGRPRYALRAMTPVGELRAFLQQQRLPLEWSASILAGDTGIASYRHMGAAGEARRDGPAGEGAAGEQGAGGEPGTSPLVLTRAAVGDWSWTVVIAVPEEAFVRPLRQLLVRFGVGGLLCLLLGLAASLWLARRLDRDVSNLATASVALATGERPYDEGVIIREMGEVRACLLAARDREEQALTDPITGLPTRGRFQELAEKLECRARNEPGLGLAVLFVDLDGFKLVNDVHGHEQGDRVLAAVARVLRQHIRETDVAGRLGGDEFVVCLAAPAGHVREAAAAMAVRIVSGVAAIGYGLGCSIGVAVCLRCSPSLKRGLELADAAMYEAKRLGKNRYVLRLDETRDESG
ncbi:MAG: sensor domain-containing diguanylate cyclase [Solidesulfovibrio sp. DCME]|uniref:sensor domain-containing diguanylate cyclase n=1 Tax=Solidesulfovibrio sp. DCME TaxID=3447380 RepID=UPI003D0F7A11